MRLLLPLTSCKPHIMDALRKNHPSREIFAVDTMHGIVLNPLVSRLWSGALINQHHEEEARMVRMAGAKCWRVLPSVLLSCHDNGSIVKPLCVCVYICFFYVVLNSKTKKQNERLGLESINLEVAEAPDSCQRNFCSKLF